MKCTVPLQADKAGNPLGLFSIDTSSGHIVILFTNPGRWDEFADVVGQVLKRHGAKLASVDLDADSFEAAVAQLLKMDPSLRGTAHFLPDSTPVFGEALRLFQEQLKT